MYDAFDTRMTGVRAIDQRYYASAYGRFNTPDPARSARPKNPLSWNRYSYTAGDPVNRNDRRGLCYYDLTIGQGFDTYGDWLEAVYQNSGGAMSSDTTDDRPDAPCADSGGSIDVSDTATPVPCVSSSGASTDCGNDSDDPVLQLAQQVSSNLQNSEQLMMLLAAGAAAPVALEGLVASAGNTILLGTFADGYVNLGGIVGASTFTIPNAVWSLMSPAQQWADNQAFLDAAIANNAVIVLGSNAATAVQGSGFWQEIQYLISQGYQVSADGTQMIHP